MTKADEAIAYAALEIGSPYVFGDEGPDTFDCSGLVQFVYGKVGIKTPRTAREQQAWATPVASPKPGDLVFWGRPATHVGLYIGGGQMIDAAGRGKPVNVRDVWGTPAGYGRVPGAGTALGSAVTSALDFASPVTDFFANAGEAIAGRARELLVEGGFVILGLALAGVGLYVAVRGGGQSLTRKVLT